MSGLTFSGDGLLQRFSNQLGELGARAPVALARALNHTGAKAKTAVIRNLVIQTGLKRSVIVRAVKVQGARHGNEQFKARNTDRLTYTLTTTGGDISLKFFDPKETKAGVSASPRGRRQLFHGTFTKGGRFPNRKGPVMGGHVFTNVSMGHAWRGKVRLENSGVYIPDEMLQGASAAAFDRIMGSELEARVSHEIGLLMGMPGL
nr:phage tail protein [Methylobacterium sp. OTU13CASTA1]